MSNDYQYKSAIFRALKSLRGHFILLLVEDKIRLKTIEETRWAAHLTQPFIPKVFLTSSFCLSWIIFIGKNYVIFISRNIVFNFQTFISGLYLPLMEIINKVIKYRQLLAHFVWNHLQMCPDSSKDLGEKAKLVDLEWIRYGNFRESTFPHARSLRTQVPEKPGKDCHLDL